MGDLWLCRMDLCPSELPQQLTVCVFISKEKGVQLCSAALLALTENTVHRLSCSSCFVSDCLSVYPGFCCLRMRLPEMTGIFLSIHI